MTNNVSVFEDYSKYYDLLYTDKDYEGEIDYVCGLLDSYGQLEGSVLELGSGTGIHGRLLASQGYEVLGVELSSDMVKLAEQTDGFKCMQGDMTSIQIEREFDVALSLFHVVSYLTADAQMGEMFKNINKHLKMGGLFIFDIWYSPCVKDNPPELRVKRMSNDELEIVRISEPTIHEDLKRVDVKFSIFSRRKKEKSWRLTEEFHPMRHFSNKEIEKFAIGAGFRILKAEEFYTAKPLAESAWGACFVVEKIRQL